MGLIKLLFFLISVPRYINSDQQDGPLNLLINGRLGILDINKSTTNDSTDEGELLLLTPLIEEGRITEAKKLAYVDKASFLDVNSYSGYLTVDKYYGSNLWFWYVPVQSGRVNENPLLIWLQGGPGDTSLFGLFKEIGPFKVDESSRKLEANPYSWHQNHSIIFIDNPVGVGYSFSRNDSGISESLIEVTENLYEFVRQFLQLFPELKSTPLYLTGESYAGKYIPYLAYEIHNRNLEKEDKINLQGLAIGNGFIDPPSVVSLSRIASCHGLVDDKGAKYLKDKEDRVREFLRVGNITSAIEEWKYYFTNFMEQTKLQNIYNYADDKFEGMYETETWASFIRESSIKKHLHVGNILWNRQTENVRSSLENELFTSAKELLEKLLDYDYKIMVYSGNLDMMIPYQLSVELYKSLNWKGSDSYLKATRLHWISKKVLAGYITSAKNFVEVMIRNAGHMAPADQPRVSQILMVDFTRGRLFNMTEEDLFISD